MKKLIIIPAFNEEGNIVKTVNNIKENAPEFDYVIINDCSTDNTLKICRENGFNHIDLPVNLGIGGAVQTGYIYARENGYDCAVQVDGDGQHDAAFLSEMAMTLEKENADMVIGSRFIKMEGFQSSALRRMGIRYFTNLIKFLTGAVVTDPTSGLRMVNRRTLEMFASQYPSDYPEPDSVVTLLKKKGKVVEIPVKMKERESGQSSISARKSVYYMVKVTMAILLESVANK